MEEKTFVCLSCYYKGYDFIDEINKLGNRVILITSENLREKNWPWHAIDEVFYMPEIAPSVWNLDHLIQGFSHILKTTKVDAIIALDDYDVEKAALLRETFRISGMGQTTYRYFRDKLAMRQQALDAGINVPEFTAIFNNETVHDFIRKNPAPWVLKPRSEASASGIIKIQTPEELWLQIDKLGPERHLFLLESFKPGDVFHVDSLVNEKEIIFNCCSQYLSPPMKVSHEGGVFRSKTLNRYSQEYKDLEEINQKVIAAFGLLYGATHSEYIKGQDGNYYFLETSSRVGGAHIADLIEAATCINIWKQWARLENALLKNLEFSVEKPTGFSAGLLIALSKDLHPDTSEFECEEVYRFLPIDNHIGIVYKSGDEKKIDERLETASQIITEKILNILPPKDKPTS